MSSVNQEDAEQTSSMDVCGINSSPLTRSSLNTNSNFKAFGKIDENEDELSQFREEDKNRSRICSERSDSGISDCSSIASSASHLCQCAISSTPLLSKKFSITEDVELNFCADSYKTDVQPTDGKQSSTNTMGTKVDDIRKKFAHLSRNIDEMDKKLENVGRELGDIGPGKFTNAKRTEIRRVPSLKDAKRSHLMQPTASSQGKTTTPKPQVSPRPALTIPTSPELRTSKLARLRSTPSPTAGSVNGNCKNNQFSVSSAAKTRKADGLKSQSSVDSGVSIDSGISSKSTAAKRADFLRLQQMYNSNKTEPSTVSKSVTKDSPTKTSSVVASSSVCSRKSKEVPSLENSKTSGGNSLNFQKTVAFWKR